MFVLQILSCGNLMYSAVRVQAYNGDDYNGARIVSRAYELPRCSKFICSLLLSFGVLTFLS
jgi:hypothetical protein